MTRVRVTIPATSCNLGPGLDCMALALELYNIVELAESEHGLHVDSSGDFASEDMKSSARLALKAITGVFRKAGYLPGGLRVHLDSHIPPGDSLGGDAATLLGGAAAANILLGSPFTREEVLHVALGIKDRPHALLAAQLGGLVICSGRDGDLTYASVPIAPMKVIAVLPSTTADGSPSAPPQQVSLADAVFNIGHAALVAQALSGGSFDLLGRAMRDRLHETARSKTIPGCREMIDAAHESGAAAVSISGRGPALIAFSEGDHDQIAKSMARAYRKATGGEAQTWVLPVDTQGISISEMGITAFDKPIPAGDHPVTFDRQKSHSHSPITDVARIHAPSKHLTFAPNLEGQNP